MGNLLETIKGRKSIRTYDGNVISEDHRKDLEEYIKDVPNPFDPGDDEKDILEMVRWAPSAVNKQPWRIIFKDGIYHFYEKKDKGYVNDDTGDLQKIDVGIALCHFCMGLEEKGMRAETPVNNPGIEIPEDVEYIISVGPGR